MPKDPKLSSIKPFHSHSPINAAPQHCQVKNTDCVLQL